ncbi:hypothetical protein EYF80_020606 [Liparis tanakae]|uniref:Uncharacterized protein n=1 Tax=Liparis tanakae TaxID=230148 RepID=A0A4Z2HTJ9_9TELE|nr:hypothetical protein EYF80_020606 [Liparis tanakae]
MVLPLNGDQRNSKAKFCLPSEIPTADDGSVSGENFSSKKTRPGKINGDSSHVGQSERHYSWTTDTGGGEETQ